MHVISCEQYTKQSLGELYDLTCEIAKNPTAFNTKLSGKIIASLFFEPSTRTRMSFESAALRLGASVITTENGNADSSVAKGETLEDTIKVVAGYCDAIVMRHGKIDSAERAAAVSNVPIINGGSGSGEHPTQALLDGYTILKQRGSLNGTKLAVLGDLRYGRTVKSLIKLVSLYEGVQVYGLSMEQFALQLKYIEFLKSKGIEYNLCKGFEDIPADVDVIYHTRIQAERFDEAIAEHKRTEKFIVNKAVLDRFSPNTMLLHPLPRNNEIATDVDDDPRAMFFQQAHNGVPVRMAILLKAMGLS